MHDKKRQELGNGIEPLSRGKFATDSLLKKEHSTVLLDAELVLELFICRYISPAQADSILACLHNQFVHSYISDLCVAKIHFYFGYTNAQLAEDAIQYLETVLNVKAINTKSKEISDLVQKKAGLFDSDLEAILAVKHNIGCILALRPELYADFSIEKPSIDSFLDSGCDINAISKHSISSQNLENIEKKLLQSTEDLKDKLKVRYLLEFCSDKTSFTTSSSRDFRGANFRGTNLSGLDLSGIDFRDASFQGATLNNTKMCGSNLSRANFSNADLSRADLSRANLNKAHFKNSIMLSSILDYADLTETDLTGSVLTGSSMESVNLEDSKLNEADISSVKFSRRKSFRSVFSSC